MSNIIKQEKNSGCCEQPLIFLVLLTVSKEMDSMVPVNIQASRGLEGAKFPSNGTSRW